MHEGTAVLLFLIGRGRARPGKRPAFRTILEMMAIATAAGSAGVVSGLLLTRQTGVRQISSFFLFHQFSPIPGSR